MRRGVRPHGQKLPPLSLRLSGEPPSACPESVLHEQICQFCYNNIKTTMNGLCPACRRQYDERTIQYKAVSPEEYVLSPSQAHSDPPRLAQHRQNIAQQAKKKAAAKQKEAQKREADHLSRKHLAGLRVRQRNLVYVTGLKPKVTGEKLVEGLRSKDFFGQYGEIIKVVVSKSNAQNQSVGVYVTFKNKEDAACCIQTIDGYKLPDGNRLRCVDTLGLWVMLIRAELSTAPPSIAPPISAATTARTEIACSSMSPAKTAKASRDRISRASTR